MSDGIQDMPGPDSQGGASSRCTMGIVLCYFTGTLGSGWTMRRGFGSLGPSVTYQLVQAVAQRGVGRSRQQRGAEMSPKVAELPK